MIAVIIAIASVLFSAFVWFKFSSAVASGNTNAQSEQVCGGFFLSYPHVLTNSIYKIDP